MKDFGNLREYGLFRLLSEEQLSELAIIAEERGYKKGAHVHERGGKASNLFLVKKGRVGLRDIGPGDVVGVSYETCDPGQFFGAASLIGEQQYSLTAVCLEESEVLAIDSKRLFQLCEKDFQLGYNLMLTIAKLYFDRYTKAKKQVYEMVKTPPIITALPG